MNNVCYVEKIGTQYSITLTQQGRNNFTVIYGSQLKDRLNYAQAATEFGECLFHALACDGKLDNQ